MPDLSTPNTPVPHWTVEKVRDLALQHGYRPNTVVEMMGNDGWGNVELMSWPFPTEDGEAVHVMARMGVGDPTTLEEIDVKTLGDVRYTRSDTE